MRTKDTCFLSNQEILIENQPRTSFSTVCCSKPFLSKVKETSVDNMSIFPALKNNE